MPFYIRNDQGEYLTDVEKTIRPRNVGAGISQLTIERKWTRFNTREEAERELKRSGLVDIAHVTDIPPPEP